MTDQHLSSKEMLYPVQDTEALAWALRAHEDLAKMLEGGGGNMLHVRANRALGILFGEVERLEKILYPLGQPDKPSGELEASQRLASIMVGAAGKHAERVVELEAEVSTLRESLAEVNRLLSFNCREVERLRALGNNQSTSQQVGLALEPSGTPSAWGLINRNDGRWWGAYNYNIRESWRNFDFSTWEVVPLYRRPEPPTGVHSAIVEAFVSGAILGSSDEYQPLRVRSDAQEYVRRCALTTPATPPCELCGGTKVTHPAGSFDGKPCPACSPVETRACTCESRLFPGEVGHAYNCAMRSQSETAP